MKKALLAAGVLAAVLSPPAPAAMVTARWGGKGPVQHPGTVQCEPAGETGTLMVVDLSALPKGAEVYRARLLFSGVNWKENAFDIVPAKKVGGKPQAAGKRLESVGPWHQWLDATEAVRGWAKGGRKPHLLWMRSGRAFDRDATVLEIAYEGKPAGKLPRQVSGVQAAYRSGQVFITFAEIDPPGGGKDRITWAELEKDLKRSYYGPRPGGGKRRLRYLVFRHDKPVTAANIGGAELLAEVVPGSGINARQGLYVDPRRKTTSVRGISRVKDTFALRLAVQPGSPVGPGTGLYVHTVRKAGRAYYAVLAAEDGAANAADISAANTAGPVDQRPAEPRPVMYKEIVHDLGKAGKYAERWYSYWTVQPMSPWPARYDVVVGSPDPKPKEPTALSIVKGGWNSYPYGPNPRRSGGIHMSHTSDQPIEFRCGLHDAIGTIKGFDRGKWQPFHGRRQDAIVEWVCANWRVDRNRIAVHMGAWGWHEFKRGDLYAYVDGWVQPEMTKGFLSWGWACRAWGEPKMYKGRPDEENAWLASNATQWVLEHPRQEMPFVRLHMSVGAHLTEMGWPPFPRCFWAMMKTKRAFAYVPGGCPLRTALARGTIRIRADQSLPAFAHCTLDDNPGEGDLRSGENLGCQVNGHLLWETETIVDEPARWEMTVYLGEKAPLGECTVDLTPRRCRKFKATKGQKFAYTNTLLAPPAPAGGKGEKAPAKPPAAKVVQRAPLQADEHGFVTIEKLRVTKGRHRITIARAR